MKFPVPQKPFGLFTSGSNGIRSLASDGVRLCVLDIRLTDRPANSDVTPEQLIESSEMNWSQMSRDLDVR